MADEFQQKVGSRQIRDRYIGTWEFKDDDRNRLFVIKIREDGTYYDPFNGDGRWEASGDMLVLNSFSSPRVTFIVRHYYNGTFRATIGGSSYTWIRQ